MSIVCDLCIPDQSNQHREQKKTYHGKFRLTIFQHQKTGQVTLKNNLLGLFLVIKGGKLGRIFMQTFFSIFFGIMFQETTSDQTGINLLNLRHLQANSVTVEWLIQDVLQW